MGCSVSKDDAVATPVIAESVQHNMQQKDSEACLHSWQAILAGETEGFKTYSAGLTRNSSESVATYFFSAFYDRLFELSQQTRILFQHGGLQRKSRALMRMIGSALELEAKSSDVERAAIVKKLQDVARVHSVEYGVSVVHYEPTKLALLYALEKVMGKDWTPQLNLAWTAVMNFCLSVMVPVAEKYSKSTVVIVGGGFGGVNAAQTLDETKNFNVVLIDRTKYYYNNLASLRAMVQKGFAVNFLVPYSELFSSGLSFVVNAEVTEIVPPGGPATAETTEEKKKIDTLDGGFVRVHGRHAPVAYDYIVIATGHAHAFPSKLAAPSVPDMLALFDEAHDVVHASSKIVIAGGGAVGCELAGELKTAFPEREITIVHARRKLLADRMDEELRDATHDRMDLLGVKYILNERMVLGEKMKAAADKSLRLMLPVPEGKLVTDKGTEVECDIVCFCAGPKLNNKSFANTFASAMGGRGKLKTNRACQVDGYTNVFAVGDCSDLNPPDAVHARSNGKTAAENIIKLEAKKSEFLRERGAKGEVFENLKSEDILAAMKHAELSEINDQPYGKLFVLSVGPDHGVLRAPTGEMQTDEAAVHTKSKQLFVPGMWEYLKANKEAAEASGFYTDTHVDLQSDREQYEEDIKALQTSMHISRKEAEQVLRYGAPEMKKTGKDINT